MIKIAICDDDKSYISYMKEIIQEAGLNEDDVIYYEYLSGEQFIKDFKKSIDYDLLILDVQMQSMNGNEVAVKFRERYLNTMLVFCSGVHNPCPSSFKVSPFRYLLKQYARETMVKEVKEIVEVLKQREQEPYIIGYYYNNSVKLQPKDIVYASIAKTGSNIFVHPNNIKFEFEKHIRCKKKLKEVYEILEDYDFVYIHNSYIVNMNYIKRKTMKEIELVNKEFLTISRSKEKVFREKFTKFLAKKY